jgi:hypothetical protein
LLLWHKQRAAQIWLDSAHEQYRHDGKIGISGLVHRFCLPERALNSTRMSHYSCVAEPTVCLLSQEVGNVALEQDARRGLVALFGVLFCRWPGYGDLRQGVSLDVTAIGDEAPTWRSGPAIRMAMERWLARRPVEWPQWHFRRSA